MNKVNFYETRGYKKLIYEVGFASTASFDKHIIGLFDPSLEYFPSNIWPLIEYNWEDEGEGLITEEEGEDVYIETLLAFEKLLPRFIEEIGGEKNISNKLDSVIIRATSHLTEYRKKKLLEKIVKAFQEKYPKEFNRIEPLCPYKKSYTKELTVEVDGCTYYYYSSKSTTSITGEDTSKAYPRKEGKVIEDMYNFNNEWAIIRINDDKPQILITSDIDD